jgi:hypothetical protein
MSGNYLGPPQDSHLSGFEWGGEWTVTYETFRDMGIAFAVALVLIYMLVVWEFGNFTLPAIVVAPIPLTLIGIIPGHWLLNAEFTATSMIGFIALAGIIVRNSILLVDFSKHEIARGVNVVDAVINACKTRTRPIIITAFALVAGSSVILFDPIFQGMAISLLFGVLVSTLLTLLVIPLGCISGRKAFGVETEYTEGPVGVAGGAAMPLSPLPQGAADQGAVAGKRGKGKFGRSILSLLYYIGMYVFVLIKDIIVGTVELVFSIARVIGRRLKTNKSDTKDSVRVPIRNDAVSESSEAVGESSSVANEQRYPEGKQMSAARQPPQSKVEQVNESETQTDLKASVSPASSGEKSSPRKSSKPVVEESIVSVDRGSDSALTQEPTAPAGKQTRVKGTQTAAPSKRKRSGKRLAAEKTSSDADEVKEKSKPGPRGVSKRARTGPARKARRGIRLKHNIMDE